MKTMHWILTKFTGLVYSEIETHRIEFWSPRSKESGPRGPQSVT